MESMGNPRASKRTRNGFSRVQKGRSYTKPPLGDYHSSCHVSTDNSYSRTDYRDRLVLQPHIFGDIESMKRAGHVIPSVEEVVFSDRLVTQPWTAPPVDRVFARPKFKPRRRKHTARSIKMTNKTSDRSVSEESVVIPKADESVIEAAKWQKRVKAEFRQTIVRMSFPAVFGYLITGRSFNKKKTPSRMISHVESRGSEFERDLIDRVKKSVSTIKSFTANKIPWKTFQQPQSVSKISMSTLGADARSDYESIPDSDDVTDSDTTINTIEFFLPN